MVLINAFNKFVHPLLEYGIVVWSPSAKMTLREIYTVLKRFSNQIHPCNNETYDIRQSALNEHSLQSCCITRKLIMCFKQLYRLIDIDCNIFFKLANSSVTRQHQFQWRRNRGLRCFNELEPPNSWSPIK